MWRRCLIYISLNLIVLVCSIDSNDFMCHKIYHKEDLVWNNGFLYNKNNSKPIDDTDFISCLCKFRSCLVKCCKSSEIMINSLCSKDDRILDIKPYLLGSNDSKQQYLLKTRKIQGFLLDPELEPLYTFNFTKDGLLYLGDQEDFDNKYFSNNEYCVDIFKDPDIDYKVRVLFSPEETEEENYVYKRMGKW
ncbi:hypothetical protein WA026_012943 [Henosepilachna vigintioctopunctata]|uniref:Methuselah N-terminal domain-containing protein n=1 Tax=Henosepilachna vigintioctopunctata TaxID=420089 RepID=A0AAW1TTY6_9CUCU